MDPRQAWAGQRQWRVLHGGPGAVRHFLATWRAWHADPQRPRLLHHVAIDPAPALQAADDGDPLAAQLAQRWTGLTPGLHRFSFDDGRVLLTLCVGELGAILRELAFRADAILIGALDTDLLKALPRLCRRGTLLQAQGPAAVPAGALASAGFVVDAAAAPALRATYAPAWPVRNLPPHDDAAPAECVVIGAGLAGAAVAASLARRGSAVQVLDAGEGPATGASSLPAGLMAPHQSPDDNLLSRLSRAGIRITWQECARLLRQGTDWAPTGALEHRGADRRTVPAVTALDAWSRDAAFAQKTSAGLQTDDAAWWHATAAWVRPAALVQAWLATPGVAVRSDVAVHDVVAEGDAWLVRDAAGAAVARAPLVIVAAAGGTPALVAGRVTVHPVRGQVTWGLRQPGDVLPPFPVNGNGHFLPDVRIGDGRPAWLTGSTYGRADADPRPRKPDDAANLDRLRELLPRAAAQLAPRFADGSVRAWSNVRWASTDRRPLVGALAPGLWVSTAMGSRGLTFAALCGELIAARLHGEPWPLEARLAQAIDALR